MGSASSGPGPIDRQYQHAADLARAIGPFAGRFLDLGSGGGLPGLVLVDRAMPEATGRLLDSHQRRCDFLRQRRSSGSTSGSGRGGLRTGRGARPGRRPPQRLRSRGGALVRTPAGDGRVRGRVPAAGRATGGDRAARRRVRGGPDRPAALARGRAARARVRPGGGDATRRHRRDPDDPESTVDERWPRREGSRQSARSW